MSVQTSYSIDHAGEFVGMIADQQLHNSVSKLNKGTSIIGWGKGVVTDGEDGAKLPVPGSVTAEFIGVTMRELNRAYTDAETTGGAVGKNDFTVVTHGVIWVVATDAVDKDDPVFLRVGATNTGDFAKVAGSSGTLSVAIAGAKFLTAAAAQGDLVKISLGIGG